MIIFRNFKQSSLKVGNSVFLKKDKYIKNPLYKLLFTIIVILLILVLNCTGIGCVWKFFFKIPCPGGGITRACLCAIAGNFSGAFKYNFMFPSVPLIFLYILFDGRIFSSKTVDTLILSAVGIGFFVHWIITLF